MEPTFAKILKTVLLYRQLIAFIFLAAFVAQTFNRSFVMVDYYSNTSKYAKNCENKAKPILKCNGKCQMIKKLKQEEKKDEENPERKAENKNEITLSSKSFFANVNIAAGKVLPKNKYPFHTDNYQHNNIYSIFHPPKL